MRIVWLPLLLAMACGSSQKSDPAPDPEPTGDPADPTEPADPDDPAADPAPVGEPNRPVAGGDKLWSEMKRKERQEHMKDHVVPKMQELWGEFDPKKYKKVTCILCHGDGVLDGNYEMPNPELPRLDFGKGWPEFAEKHERILEFMKTKVSPTMADLLGLAKYSKTNPEGFGCMNCHMAAEH